MAAAARRAGFNPLTVLRATGGAGFGGTNAVMPVMSKQNFAATFMSNAFGQYLTDKKNAPVEEYNKAVRTMDIQQRIHDIAISRKTLENMGKVPEQDRAMEVPIFILFQYLTTLPYDIFKAAVVVYFKSCSRLSFYS